MHVPEQPAELAGLGAVGRQRVARRPGEEVAGVPRPLAEPVRLAQRVRVLIGDEARAAQPLERVDRRRRADLGVRRAVLELEQLHGELDVRERAAAQLEVELGVLARRDALPLDARLHAPHLAHVVLGERVAVHERLDELDEPLGELGVAGDRTRLEQRLELPRQRPPLVVRPVAVEAARERALLALGSQVGVDAERLALGAWSRRSRASAASAVRSAAAKSAGPSPS